MDKEQLIKVEKLLKDSGFLDKEIIIYLFNTDNYHYDKEKGE